MIKVENCSVSGFETAIRGMRNPMNSWHKSDSKWVEKGYKIGKNDLTLMKKLFKAGTEHRKYLRMIHVSMDITAPLYWWKEFDTYKVGTVANSCSTMHKIAAKEFTLDDFSIEHLQEDVINSPFLTIISCLNFFRDLYNREHNKDDWWQIIQLLPSSYNQRRTVDLNYETVFTIIRQRTGHKLDEWRELVEFLKTLPYILEIGGFDESSATPKGNEE